MKKIIKKIGRSTAIIFSPDEQKIYGIRVGDLFNVELAREKREGKNNENSI